MPSAGDRHRRELALEARRRLALGRLEVDPADADARARLAEVDARLAELRRPPSDTAPTITPPTRRDLD